MKIVMDTNVLASAATTRGLCADVLREVFAKHDLVVCKQITDELQRILIDKFGIDPPLVGDFLWLIRQDTIFVEPQSVPNVALKDKDDLGILAAAIASKADILVTGDKELQELERIGTTAILSPREFWQKPTNEPEN